MLYVKSVGENGKDTFHPIKDNNVYILCKKCGQMVPVHEPAGFLYELGACASSIEAADICDACLDKDCELEDELLKKNPAEEV